MRRPTQRRRRIGIAALAAVALLLVATAILSQAPAGASPAAIAAGPAAVAAQEPTPSASASAVAAASPSPSAAAPAEAMRNPSSPTDTAAVRAAGIPPHRAIDDWPPATPAPAAWLTGYVWPIAHPRLTLPFGPTVWGSRVVDGKLFHDGVDLATFCGDRILAAHDGVVLAAGRHFDDFIGWVGSLTPYYDRLNAKHLWSELPIVVITDDGNGYRSVYAHFSKVVVRPGQLVRAGQLIGYEGMSGHATGCHLHYSLFSPLETATFGIEPKVAKDMRLPRLEIARIDPMLVFPFRKGLGGVIKPMGG
jgi:murein DD-endopeptidase MepM/ murein hydrolase activator NlpD